MVSKLITVDSCDECIFCIYDELLKIAGCRKTNEFATIKNLFKQCPLPNVNTEYKKRSPNESTLSNKEIDKVLRNKEIYKVEHEGKVFRR